MQVQSNLQTLLASHLTIAFNLFVQCCYRSHNCLITHLPATYNFNPASVTAPSDADVTWLAYFANTPRV
jgi:hypothetical protein